jgi:hypothetical protein
MTPTSTHQALEYLIDLQHAVEARLGGAGVGAADVLEVGRSVVEFAEREEAAFFPILPLLDPEARVELAAEHQQLAEDLQLLQWMVETTPDSPDVATFAGALARRMRDHIARDGRLLAHAARLT